jgi:hypothetical protein
MQETGVKAEVVGDVVQIYIDVGYTIINIQKTGEDSYTVTAE